MSTAMQSAMFAGTTTTLKPFVGSVVYETKGRAREYRELACNLYTGCDHRCIYCYAPDVLCKSRIEFDSPAPRANIIAKLRHDAQEYGKRGERRQVLFCFACDPYQSLDVRYALTRQAIQTCHENGMAVSILTKGGARALRDLDLFGSQDAFASTLTFLDDARSQEWEPGAALPSDRLQTLQAFHAKGISTWVSLEPVIDPATTLDIIRQAHGFVDEFKVGTINYHPIAKTINWPKFAHDVRGLLDSLGCRYYLKQDLRRYLQ